MTSRTGVRILTSVALVTMIAAGVGFLVTTFANAFFLDDYAKYGEVDIPGSNSLALPAGDVTVSFHTVLVGGSGTGLPVPALKYSITGPDGTDVELAEDYGATTTVNNDARVRIGYLHLPVDGNYRIQLDGKVSAYLDPTLAFGQQSSYGSLPWILGPIFGVACAVFVVTRVWTSRAGRREASGVHRPPPVDFGARPTWTAGAYVPPPPLQTSTSYQPSGEGVRIEQLKTLARLRDSGALTEAEYTAEKRRVLEGL